MALTCVTTFLATQLPVHGVIADPGLWILWSLTAIISIATFQALMVEFPSLGFRNPGILIFAYIFVSYILRPAYIMITGDFGTSFVKLEVSEYIESFRLTQLVVLTGFSLFWVGYFLAPRRLLQGLFRKQRTLTFGSLLRLAIVAAISLAAAAYVLGDIASLKGGWQSALQSRARFYEGRNYLILLITAYRSAFLVWMAISLQHRQRRSLVFWLLATILWLPSLMLDALSGGRGEMVVYNILPFFMLLSYYFRKSPLSRLITIFAALLAVVVIIGYRAVVRDQFTGANTASVTERLLNVPNEFLGGNETTVFDALMLIIARVPRELPFRGVSELLNMMATALLPSALYNKPERTTTVLTRELAPEYYARGGNLTFSAAGDLYFSGGLIAVLIGMTLLGIASGWLIRSAAANVTVNDSFLALLFGWVAAGFIYNVIRTDLYGVSLGIVRLGIIVGFAILLPRFVNTRRIRGDGSRSVLSRGTAEVWTG